MRRGAARIARRGSSRGHRAKGPIRAAAHRSGSIQPFSLRVLCPDLAPAFRRPFARAPQRGIARCRPRPAAREPHRTTRNDRAADCGFGAVAALASALGFASLERAGGRCIRGALARLFPPSSCCDRWRRSRAKSGTSSARARRRRAARLHHCRRALSGNGRRRGPDPRARRARLSQRASSTSSWSSNSATPRP